MRKSTNGSQLRRFHQGSRVCRRSGDARAGSARVGRSGGHRQRRHPRPRSERTRARPARPRSPALRRRRVAIAPAAGGFRCNLKKSRNSSFLNSGRPRYSPPLLLSTATTGFFSNRPIYMPCFQTVKEHNQWKPRFGQLGMYLAVHLNSHAPGRPTTASRK